MIFSPPLRWKWEKREPRSIRHFHMRLVGTPCWLWLHTQHFIFGFRVEYAIFWVDNLVPVTWVKLVSPAKLLREKSGNQKSYTISGDCELRALFIKWKSVLISMPFGSLNTNTKVTCSGQWGSIVRLGNCEIILILKWVVVVAVGWLSEQNVLGAHLSCALFTESTQNQK